MKIKESSLPKSRKTDTSLPGWKAICFPLIFISIVFAILVILGYSGTSSGILWQVLQGNIPDPRLISGIPRGIRSDEWLVQQSWVVSQVIHNFPVFNSHFPGGMDMTVFNDLPVWEWSSIFRPHVWGYMFLGLDHGAAWYWWFPSVILISSIYIFSISLAPKRIIFALFISMATLCSPFIQWWYQPTTILSVSWLFILLSSLTWQLKSESRKAQLVWAAIACYATVNLALEIYLPFIIPSALIFLFVGSGLISRYVDKQVGFKGNFIYLTKKLSKLLVAGLISIFFITFWVITRLETIKAILSTAYPGQRTISTGSGLYDPNVKFPSFFGAPFNGILKNITSSSFGTNSSEASSAFPLAVIVIPSACLVIWYVWKNYKKLEWPVISSVIITGIFLAFLYLPNWDFLSHLLGLHLVPAARLKIAFVMLLPIMAILIVELIDKYSILKSWVLFTAVLVTSFIIYAPLILRLNMKQDMWNALEPIWPLILVLFVFGTALLFVKKLATLASALVFTSSLLTVWGVNPIYFGIYNLDQTNTGETISRINLEDSGVWIGVGGWVPAALLTQSEVISFSGVQTYPIRDIWSKLDPESNFEFEWNRLGHTRWELHEGNIQISNPQADVISVALDPCSPIVQNNVKYILSDKSLGDSFACLEKIERTKEKNMDFWIYKITQ